MYVSFDTSANALSRMLVKTSYVYIWMNIPTSGFIPPSSARWNSLGKAALSPTAQPEAGDGAPGTARSGVRSYKQLRNGQMRGNSCAAFACVWLHRKLAIRLYAERQENVDAEERRTPLDNNREKLPCSKFVSKHGQPKCLLWKLLHLLSCKLYLDLPELLEM